MTEILDSVNMLHTLSPMSFEAHFLTHENMVAGPMQKHEYQWKIKLVLNKSFLIKRGFTQILTVPLDGNETSDPNLNLGPNLGYYS